MDGSAGYPEPKRRLVRSSSNLSLSVNANANVQPDGELKPCDSLSRIRKRASIFNKSKSRAYAVDAKYNLPMCNGAGCRRPIRIRNDAELRGSMCPDTWHSYGWRTFFCNECMLRAIDLWASNMDFASAEDAGAVRPYCAHCLVEPPAGVIGLYDTKFSCADAPTRPRQIMLCRQCAEGRTEGRTCTANRD